MKRRFKHANWSQNNLLKWLLILDYLKIFCEYFIWKLKYMLVCEREIQNDGVIYYYVCLKNLPQAYHV